MRKQVKVLLLVISGNCIDYYDFLLFAHLGYFITPKFLPNLDQNNAHLISLLLFSLPFIVRPLGGYIFGKISDLSGRTIALSISLKWAGFASLGIAFLPEFETGGVVCSILFVLLRALQGFSLGGEYPTAGTYLMENYYENKGMLSGILAASGTVGSLFAFSFAWLMTKPFIPDYFWRFAFVLGGIVSLISFYLRKILHTKIGISNDNNSDFKTDTNHLGAIILTISTGALVGATTWLPMTYSNYYLTKVLSNNIEFGLIATLISLIVYIIATPLFGKLADIYPAKCVMMISALSCIPLSLFGFMLVFNNHLTGQILLTLAAASFGAPIHVFMNELFPQNIRSRNINLFFMIGTAFGSLLPVISGYLVNRFGQHFIPVIFVSSLSAIVFCVFHLLLNKQVLPEK